MSSSAFAKVILCPGQGSQFLQMGKRFSQLNDAFSPLSKRLDYYSQLLQFPFRDYLFTQDERLIRQTCIAQPLIVCYTLLQNQIQPLDVNEYETYYLGHSLGEYTALYLAGILLESEVLQLVKARGKVMQQCTELNPCKEQGMIALYLTHPNQFQPLLKYLRERRENDNGIVDFANRNTDRQIVLSGTFPCLEQVANDLQTLGYATKAIRIPVQDAFHSRIMAPAASLLSSTAVWKETDWNAIQQRLIEKTKSHIMSNVTGTPYHESKQTVERLLLDQMAAPVQWWEMMQWVKKRNISQVYDIGARPVLGHLWKKSYPNDEIHYNQI